MELKKGKFIVLYGINNLGKTTQAKMLADHLNEKGINAEYLKYPTYELEPAGKLINDYLRHNNPYNFTHREFHLLHYIDRISFEPMLKNKLSKGINVIAEDYFGTALAWGLAAGVEEDLLKYLYSFLYPEDMAFLFDGERFVDSIEKSHLHETNSNLVEKARTTHLKIALEYGWQKINANLPIMEIHGILWNKVYDLITGPTINSIAPNFKELHDQQYITGQHITPKNDQNRISVQRLSPIAKLPEKISATDSGYDLFANEFLHIPAGKKTTVRTGIKLSIPARYIGLIWNKDILSSDNLHVFSTIIDKKFNDEIFINAVNTGKSDYTVYPGMKIAKIYFKKIENLDMVESEI